MITVSDLRNLRNILNLSELSRQAGVSYSTIDSKLRKNSELSVTQSMKFMRALKHYGLTFEGTPEHIEELFKGKQ